MRKAPEYMTAAEVKRREDELFSRPNPELDAAAQRAFGPILERFLAIVRAYKLPKE